MEGEVKGEAHSQENPINEQYIQAMKACSDTHRLVYNPEHNSTQQSIDKINTWPFLSSGPSSLFDVGSIETRTIV